MTDDATLVITPYGAAAHVEIGGDLLCHTNPATETIPFDDSEHDWPANGLCPACEQRCELLGSAAAVFDTADPLGGAPEVVADD